MLAHDRFSPFFYFGRYRQLVGPGRLTGAAIKTAYNLVQVIDGTLKVESAGGRWLLRAGEGSVVEPGTEVTCTSTVHCIRLAFDLVAGPRRISEDSVVVIDASRPRQPAWRELFDCALPERIAPEYLAGIRLILHRLATSNPANPIVHLVAHADLATLIAGWLHFLEFRPSPVPLTGSPDDLPRRLENLLMSLAGSHVTVKEAAGIIGYSQQHLTRIYRAARSTTPSRFLQRYRVTEACKLLRNVPPIPLDIIAKTVGLANGHSLNQCFHAVLGMSPRAWLRQAASA